MSLPPTFLDELRTRLPLTSIIGRCVRLVRYGREYIGLCPFHNEKTSSFTVNQDKGFFHCFGCGAHGDVIGFVMRLEGLSFIEAVERLSQEAGLNVPGSNPEEQAQSRRRPTLLKVMEVATAFFERQLRLPVGRIGLDYLRERGLNDTLIARFRLGFAPSGNACKITMKQDGIDEALAVDAGLLVRPNSGRTAYDTFRNRVIFPITDARGRVIAFGGRVLQVEDAQPKYLNSPDTTLFRKGSVLYGLAQARGPTLERGTVVVAEGYMDVITLAGAGFSHVVAPLGTALTEEQIITLWRLVPEPILCFDGDAAGRRAATRATKRVLPLLKPGLSVRFALLPEGKDPDDLVRTEGAPAMAVCLSRAIPLFEGVWQTLLEGRTLDTPERRAALEQAINLLTDRITDPIVRQHYRSLLHERRRTLLRSTSVGKALQRKRILPDRSALALRKRINTTPRMRDLADHLFAAFLLTHPQVLVHYIEQVAEVLSGNRELAALIAIAVGVLVEQPDLDGTALVSALECAGQEATLATFRRHLIPALQRRSPDPEADYQHMLSALHDQALTHEIETMQTVLAIEFSTEAWQRLQFLQEERYRLRVEIDQSSKA